MAFLIPDNLKSRHDIPSGVRRVASAFQVGLDEGTVVWFEPLYDPSGEKPHLVLLLPHHGIVVLEVLEVKARGLLGAIRGQIRIERDGREVEIENPLERAQRLATVLRDRIKSEPRLSGIRIPVAAGAVFTSITQEEASARGLDRILPVDRCLFRLEIDAAISGTGETALLRAFARMLGGTVGQTLTGDMEKILRGLIHPEIVIDRIAGSLPPDQLTIFRPREGEEDIIRVMDRQQESMAKSLGEGHRVIRGVAGSGKTLVLVYRARLLAQLYSNDRFLVTCYTRSLAGQLRSMLGEHSNVEVDHLDSVMAKAIRNARLHHPGYRDDDHGDAVAEVALQALDRGAGPRYRAVLLDEAQDFGTKALRFAVGLLQPGHDDLVIVADAAQNIFRRRFSWRQAGIQAQGRTRILRVNYRNTREILEFAGRFLLAGTTLRPEEVPDPEDEHAVIPPESAARAGPQPTVVLVRSVEEEVRRAVEQAERWVRQTSTPRTLAVLYATSQDDRFDRARALYERLQSAGLQVFWLNDPADRNAKDRLASVQVPVVLSTIHSAKGLEFPYVILCGIWREADDVDSNRKLAYVGMTRATHSLAVVTRDGHPLAEDLQRTCA